MNQGGAPGMGGMGGMGAMGMNPMMMGMNPMMMGMGADGMGMPGMGMGMMPGMGMGMGGMGPQGGMGGMGPPSGNAQMGVDMNDMKFYKTKICHKFMEGKCNYGPTCKYAHGEADLRPSGGGGPSQPRPPQGTGKVMTPHGPAIGGGPAMGGMGGMGGAMGMAKPQMNPAEKGAHFRTRLCEQFMKEGQCRYGSTCTFAHGQHELRQYGGGGGGGMQKPMPRPGMNVGPQMGAQKRPLDGQGSADGQKRARTESVVPPEQETLPVEGQSMDLHTIKQRFIALQQEANRFASETGHSVAIFTVGGVLTDMEPTDPTVFTEDHYVADVKGKDNQGVGNNLKVAVLKYGTGGVAKQLTTRGEIVKFVSARGNKALGELYQHQENQNANA